MSPAQARTSILAVVLLLVAGCGPRSGTGGVDLGGGNGGPVDLLAPPHSSLDGASQSGGPCDNALDLHGCGCDTAGATRACYTGPAATEHVGLCHDGTQRCGDEGEFAVWGPCTGDTLPTAEVCGDGQDHSCDGLVGCKDPECAQLQSCTPQLQCQPGSTQPCYTGPNGTSGVGACHGGVQTCDPQGQWDPACAGEVLPGQELGHCHDGVDNDCNGKTDCKDLFCLLDVGCQPMVCTPGAMQACYSGPNGTAGVGVCKGGTETCAGDGSGWGPCSGEVLPGLEGGHCTDGIDQDCNGLVDCQDPACGAAPACCVNSGNVVDGTIWVHSPDQLYRIDPSNWSLTLVGSFGFSDQMTDIAVTPSGDLYGISFSSLYSINKATAKATLVGGVSGMGNNGLTFLPDGTLLASDSAGELKGIKPSSGVVTDIGNYSSSLSSSGDLVAVGDGTMYGVSSTAPGGGDASGDNYLLRVDVTTGQATAVGKIGFGSVWGLAYADAKVIGFTNSGQVLQIDPQTGKGTLIASQGVQFWGAGMSPLVSANRCP